MTKISWNHNLGSPPYGMGVSKRRKLTAALARKSGIAGLARAYIGDAQAPAIDTTGIKALFSNAAMLPLPR